jgi:predicted ATPase/class 3 adenylate cyclase
VGGFDSEGGSYPVVQVGLFGGVMATDDAGGRLDIGPAKCKIVLAVLALSPGSAVPVTRLVDLVWGINPPRTADKTLQSYVVRLRKSLGSDSITRSGASYRLNVEAGAVDVGRFRRHLDAGDIAAALTEWTGFPLAGLATHGLAPIVDGLVEQWLGAVEIDLERRLDTDPLGALGALTELTADNPFREGLWSLLMTALYRVGRQADALAAFQHVRRNLLDQLGVEPGSRLRELESQILEQDEQLRARGSSSAKPAWGHPTGSVTFGFCEVEGSSRLWVAHRIKMAAAMVRLDELVRALVDRHGGFVFAAAGESFGAAFQRADDAIAWAAETQLEISREPWPGGVELRVRIGLHSGETEETANSYFGPAVNTAAAIASAGHGGQTLASEVTYALLQRNDLPERGRYRQQDGNAALRIFQLDGGEHPPLRGAGNRPGNLPLPRDRLIGRGQELDVIAGLSARGPLVTLVGPGGIGKTRLALAAAQQFDRHGADGAWLIELASISSSSDVARSVADSLEVTESPGSSLTESIIAMLQARRVLLVLDNCEHVIDGAAAIAAAIIGSCPDTKVFATSREALGIESEQLIEVLPLARRSAADLFTERSRAVSATFDPAPHRSAIEEICDRLDGIPLAIELAAARTRTLTPPDLVARLNDRLRLLTGGRRTSANRHRTLRAAIQWSYDLLTEPQQAVFKRLSIFAGPYDLSGAAAVAIRGDMSIADAEDLLQDLVERSMVLVESGPFGHRFRLLETMQEFAAEQLERDGEFGETARRHSRWCLDQVTHIHQLLVGPGEVEGVARLAQLWPDLRAAFDRACQAVDPDLAGALVRPVLAELNLRKQTEIGDWAERILELTPSTDESQIAFWLLCATHRYKQNGDNNGYERLVSRYGAPDHPVVRYTRAYLYDQGEALGDCAAAAVSWLREHGEEWVAAHEELGGVASGLMSSGHFLEVDTFVSALAARYRGQGPPTLLYVTLTILGYSAFFQGDTDRAESLFDEAAHVDVPDRTLSVNKPIEARAAFRRGDRARAFAILGRHIDELLETDHSGLAPNAAIEFVNMMGALDRLDDAKPVLQYLETTGDFGALAVRTLVADASRRVAAAEGPARDSGPEKIDARRALTHMRDVLVRVAADPSRTR